MPLPGIKLATVDAWQMARDAMQRRAANPQEQAKVAQFHQAAVGRLEPSQQLPALATPAQSAERYDKACQFEANAIRERAGRLATALQSQLTGARADLAEHRATMPAAPRGPAAWIPGAEASYSRKQNAWIDTHNELKGVASRIEKRFDTVAEFAQPGSKLYPAAAERLAATKVVSVNVV